jgi:hypothetical protein
MWYLNVEKHIHFLTYPRPTLIYTCPIALPVCQNPQHRSLLTVVSGTHAPPFQPRRRQRKVCHPVVNHFAWQTLPTVSRKHFFMNVPCIESFCPQKTPNRTLFFGSFLHELGCHFDYRNQPLNMRMYVWYLDCYEAGMCCYLLIHVENLLRPLQLFYFHLWRIYWLPRSFRLTAASHWLGYQTGGCHNGDYEDYCVLGCDTG